MDLVKGSVGGQREAVTASDLALIHQQSRKELGAEEVYTFSVRLCDNELDRDMDRFTKKTLEELAVLFVGKSGIFDHSWTAKGQACRIYRTEVVCESMDDPLGIGEGTYYLKGYAYMVRTDSTKDLIAEIEAGIKREVSVGCSVAHSFCSICGEEIACCPHTKGEYYEGKRCYASLEQGTDAYEFSFVAVPAQPKAGVMKSMDGLSLGQMLTGLLEGNPDFANWQEDKSKAWSMTMGDEAAMDLALPVEEMAQVQKKISALMAQAELGRKCLTDLQEEVKRLGALAEERFSGEMLENLVKKLDVGELEAMKSMFTEKVEKRLPIQTQLDYGMEKDTECDGAFLI